MQSRDNTNTIFILGWRSKLFEDPLGQYVGDIPELIIRDLVRVKVGQWYSRWVFVIETFDLYRTSAGLQELKEVLVDADKLLRPPLQVVGLS